MPGTTVTRRSLWPELIRWPDWAEFGPVGEWVRSVGGDSIRVEEYADGDELVVRAELPDIDPDRDVEISISGNMLHIRADRTEKAEHRGHRGYRSEFHYGSFARSLPLPLEVSAQDVKATYGDGVLEVRLPLGVESKATRIPVQRV